MSKIDTFLEKIKTAIYGKDVRDAIHDSIRMCYTDAEKAVETANASSSTANNAMSTATAASNAAKATTEKLNSIRFETDKALRNSDYPADAKATGDAIQALGSRLDNFKSETDKTLQNADYPADAKTTGDAIREIKATLDELTYKPIAISEFKSNHPTNEIGSTLSSLTLSWSVSKTPTTISSNFSDSLTPSISSFTYTGSITENKTFTLTVSDGKTTVSKSTTVAFMNGVYYGAATETELSNSFISSLTKVLQMSKARTISVNADTEQYIYYALPSRYGIPAFNVNGFDGGFEKIGTLAFTNSSSYTEDYDVWRSDNASLGSTTIKIS